MSKKIILTQLNLNHFKGIDNLSIDFNRIKTIIGGNNATGKSTIVNSYLWLLFGKDQFDRKDYEIIQIKKRKPLKKVDATVEGVLEIVEDENTTIIKLKRVYSQKWTRPRGETNEQFDGHTTSYYVNDVPVKTHKEYTEIISSIIPESIFKMVSNPSYFFNLEWKEQRNILFEMTGKIDINFEEHPELKEFSKLNDNIDINQYKKKIYEQKKEFSARLKDISVKIEQVKTMMPEEIDFSAIEIDIANLKKQIEKAKETTEKNTLTELKQKLKDLEFQAKREFSEKLALFEQSLYKDKSNLRALENENENILNNIHNCNQKISQTENLLSQLRKDFVVESARTFPEKDELICPAYKIPCDSTLACTKHLEEYDNSLDAFKKEQASNLKTINEKGIECKTQLENLKREQNEISQSSLEDKIKKAKSDIEKNEKERPVEVDVMEIPEYAEIFTQIKEWQNNESDENQQTNIIELEKKLDVLKIDLSKKETIHKYNENILSLQKEGKDLAAKIAACEKEENLITSYQKIISDESIKRINNMFELTEFQLYSTTLEGVTELTCMAIDKKEGIPVTTTNNANKVNMGLDVIKKLSDYYGISTPIFCDNAESVNEYIDIDSQLICLHVTKTSGKNLTINTEQRNLNPETSNLNPETSNPKPETLNNN